MTTAAIHQPDLLPYSGFWYKMLVSDVFVIAKHDQFQKHGYQRRVTMRGKWCSHQLVGKPALVPIPAVQVAPGWQQRLCNTIAGRYQGSKHYSTRGLDLQRGIASASGETLDEVNLALINWLREMLQIRTPLATTDPPPCSGADRLIWQTKQVGANCYLSGSGGSAYLGEDAPRYFAEQGVHLTWSTHQASTGDSIVSVLMDEDDPLEVISRHT